MRAHIFNAYNGEPRSTAARMDSRSGKLTFSRERRIEPRPSRTEATPGGREDPRRERLAKGKSRNLCKSYKAYMYNCPRATLSLSLSLSFTFRIVLQDKPSVRSIYNIILRRSSNGKYTITRINTRGVRCIQYAGIPPSVSPRHRADYESQTWRSRA